MDKIKILWADDEIDLLKPHILFLNEKGYEVEPVNNGDEVLELIIKNDYAVVLLDENMPGLSGLETLKRLKEKRNDLPVVMITKSEEEHLMEDAIGSQISDYLIKPVNPKQILHSLKKILDNKRLVSEKTNSVYQQEFRQISTLLSDNLLWSDAAGTGWVEIYKKLIYWELQLDKSGDENMMEVIKMQKAEANQLFCKFIESNYIGWLNGKIPNAPTFSHTLFKNKIMPLLEGDEPIFVVLIDNLRFDQWKVIQPIINEYFKTETEEVYCSILPTATQYARNAFFAGLLPSEIEKRFPKLWMNEEGEGSKNLHEEELLHEQLKRLGKNIKTSYNKIKNYTAGKKFTENMGNLMKNKLNVIVYNFVDTLSHAYTEMEVVRELADDEKAYRSITLSWFENSPLQDIIKHIAHKKCKLIITTDHGTIKVGEPSKIVGDKNINNNLRYKFGKNLNYVKRDVFEIRNPADAFLPKQYMNTAFVFAKADRFFAYPNNFSHYANYYRNTFQHGGVSMEEMIIPFITLSAK